MFSFLVHLIPSRSARGLRQRYVHELRVYMQAPRSNRDPEI